MTLLRMIVLMLAMLAATPALAVQPDEVLKDPALEARARALSQQLRCMVCQNQSIDDSDAPLAHDLRVLVRDRLKQGDSNQQVLDFLVARYGDFVLLKPPFNEHTWLLWLATPVVLGAGAVAMVMFARRRRSDAADPAAAPAPLSDAEQARLARLVESGSD